MAEKSTVLTIPEVTGAEMTEIAQLAQDMLVKSDDDYKIAGDVVDTISALRSEIRSTFYDGKKGPNTGPIPAAHAAWQAALAAFNHHDAPLKQAETLLASKMGGFVTWREESRRAEEERLRKEAEAKAHEERMKAVEKLVEENKPEEAAIVASAPVVVEAVEPQTPDAPELKGRKPKEVYDYRVTDEAKIPREYCIPNHKAIAGVVKSLGQKTQILGIEVFKTNKIVKRAVRKRG